MSLLRRFCGSAYELPWEIYVKCILHAVLIEDVTGRMEVLKISLVIEYQLLRKTYILWKMKLMYCRKLNCYSRRGFRVCVVNWGFVSLIGSLCRDSGVCVVIRKFVS